MQSGKVLKLHRITKLLDPRQIEQPHTVHVDSSSLVWNIKEMISFIHEKVLQSLQTALWTTFLLDLDLFQLYRINKRYTHLILNFNIIPLYFPSYSGQ